MSWKLDVDEMLKMPHHQFLIFYHEYEGKLRAWTSVEEFKRVKRYREEALEHERALYKLKEKISNNSALVEKLPPERKEQLFKLLYEDELQEEISNQSKMMS